VKGLTADLRHAMRQHAATPFSSGLAIALLAVAMAVLTTFLSFWSAMSLAGRPGFARSGELVTLGQNDGRSLSRLSLLLVERMNDEVGSLEAVAGTRDLGQVVVGAQDERVETALVTAEYFSTLRPEMQTGRSFDARDHLPGAEPVVILSYRYWRSHYNAADTALGRTVRVRASGPTIAGIDSPDTTQTYRIVGVMAPSVSGTFGDDTQMWMPYEQAAAVFYAADTTKRYRRSFSLRVVGRLAPGSTAETAAAEIRSRYGKAGMELGLIPARPLDVVEGLFMNIEARRDFVRQVQLFLASSALLALVAACNVSLFLLSRAPGRHRELGIRTAVGATGLRLLRQLATEAGLLVVTAALLGVAISLWLTRAMRQLAFLSGPLSQPVPALDWRALAMIAIVSLAMTLLVSLAPMLRLRNLEIADIGRSLAARAGWAQRLAVTTQLAAAGVLASAAIALAWHLVELSGANRGFGRSDVFVVTPQMKARAGNPFNQDAEALVGERERRRELIESIPGVERVAFGTSVPGSPSPLFSVVFAGTIPHSLIGPDESVRVIVDSVDYAFTQLLDMSIVHGRALLESDRQEVLVNETLARAVWGRTDLADETLSVGPFKARVVGVVRDAAYEHPAAAISPRMLVPALGAASSDKILVAGNLSAAQLRAGLQRLTAAGGLGFDVAGLDRVEALMAKQLAPDRSRLVLTLASAMLVVVLAALGFYGTQRYLVSAGQREFAVREALGADPRRLGRLVQRRSLLLAAPGIVLTLPLGFALVVALRNGFASSGNALVTSSVSPYAIEAAVAFAIIVLVLAASHGPARLARLTDAGPLLRED
jgi:putative ABC transport system permease protein